MVNNYKIIFLIKPSGLLFRTLLDFSSLNLADCFLKHFGLDFIDYIRVV